MRVVHSFVVNGVTLDLIATHTKNTDGTEELTIEATDGGKTYSTHTVRSNEA